MKMDRQNLSILLFVLTAMLIAVAINRFLLVPTQPIPIVAYSEFKSLLASETVEKVRMTGDEISATLNAPFSASPDGMPSLHVETYVPDIGDPDLLSQLEAQKVVIESVPEPDDTAASWLVGLLPWLVIFGLYFWFWHRMQKNMTGRFGGRDLGEFLEGSAKKEEKGAEPVTFDDVAGQENAKREVAELVEFLRNPEQYENLGAKTAPRSAPDRAAGHGQDPHGQGLSGRGWGSILQHFGVRIY